MGWCTALQSPGRLQTERICTDLRGVLGGGPIRRKRPGPLRTAACPLPRPSNAAAGYGAGACEATEKACRTSTSRMERLAASSDAARI